MKATGLLFAIFVILVWGVTFVNTKALLDNFSALEIQVIRFALGWFALCVFGKFEKFCKLLPFRDEGLLFLMGLFGVAVYQLMENCAIHHTNASNVSILVSMCPLLTAVIARGFFHGHKLNPLFFLGFAVAISGVIMVSLNGINEFHFNPIGDMFAVIAMLSWGIYSNLVERMSKRGYSQVFVIRRMFFWSLVLMSPLIAFGLTTYGHTAMSGVLSINADLPANSARFSKPMNYVNIAFLGLLASAACFVMWNKALLIVGVVRCSVGLYLLPAITAIVAYLFLGESLSVSSGVGAILILAGVVISSRQK